MILLSAPEHPFFHNNFPSFSLGRWTTSVLFLMPSEQSCVIWKQSKIHPYLSLIATLSKTFSKQVLSNTLKVYTTSAIVGQINSFNLTFKTHVLRHSGPCLNGRGLNDWTWTSHILSIVWSVNWKSKLYFSLTLFECFVFYLQMLEKYCSLFHCCSFCCASCWAIPPLFGHDGLLSLSVPVGLLCLLQLWNN